MECNIQNAPAEEWVWTVGDLVKHRNDNLLRPNPEYQRGEVWNVDQMRMLIDSMLRGYRIPLIYLRQVEYKTDKVNSTHFEIIDGQQRINAMRSFVQGAVIRDTLDGGIATKAFGGLYDPREYTSKFPLALQEQKCPWAGKTFGEFTTKEKEEFMGIKIPTATIVCEKDEEARDMFIRLQGGSDLRAQEKRDAWPGNFSLLVMQLGGKQQMRLPRHDFFTKIMKMKGVKDRGKTREIAAQILFLFLLRNAKGADELTFESLGNEALNNAYRRHIDLDLESPIIVKFRRILDELVKSFAGGARPPLAPYAAIHLVLFADVLIDAYPHRMPGIAEAYDRFAKRVEVAKKMPERPEGGDKDFQKIWEFADKTTGQGTSTADNLRARHKIFAEQMWLMLGEKPPAPRPLSLKSPQQSGGGKAVATQPLEYVQSEINAWSVRELIEERAGGHLSPNEEYQRGEVWNESQMQMLVDSVMRNYQIPLVYLHRIEQEGPKGARNVRFEIVDGQQRINTLMNFRNATIPPAGDGKTHAFPLLLNPGKSPDNRWFPDFLRQQECPWADESYSTLQPDTQKQFTNWQVPVVEIECSEDAARDMFIRLQGGTPLTPQEVRDAWPGKFCELVLEIGGKLSKNMPGHQFFKKMAKVSQLDKGAKRQLAAQTLSLFLSRRDKEKSGDGIINIGQKDLDQAYRRHVGLPLDSEDVERFRKILDMLALQFGRKPGLLLSRHEVIHLVLLADTLRGNFTQNWESEIVSAHEKFSDALRAANKAKKEGKKVENLNFLEYAEKARSSTTYDQTIRRRHAIYVSAMIGFMGDSVKRKDGKRSYSKAEREEIFVRDEKRCYFCSGEVMWADAHIHHLHPHSEGGRTTLENGVLIHRDCHQALHAQKAKRV